MNQQAVVIYCICDEVVKYFGMKDDSQCKMSSSEQWHSHCCQQHTSNAITREHGLFHLTSNTLEKYLAAANSSVEFIQFLKQFGLQFFMFFACFCKARIVNTLS